MREKSKPHTTEASVKDVAFIADSSWYLHRIFHTTKYKARDPGLNTARRLISMVCKDALACKANHLLFAFDGNEVFRHELADFYKANRDRKGPSPYDHLDQVMGILVEAGLPIDYRSAYEADDIMCSAATNFPGKVFLGTKDKDAIQYMNKRIFMYDGSAKPEPKITNYKEATERFGVPTELAVDYQMLVGDGVDNIPSFMGPKTAQNGLLLHGSFKAWWKADNKLRKKLDADALRLNRKLVRLVANLDAMPRKMEKLDLTELAWLPDVYREYRAFVHPRTRSLFGK